MADYDAADIAALLREHPHFVHGSIKGPRLTFREAVAADAAYILSLRLDPDKNQHLSPVADDVEAQARWIEAAAADPGQLYFVIEHEGRPVGTVRLYDQRGTSFSWGSWILKDAPNGSAAESMAMVYWLGMELGFTASHFEVRRGNEKVWRYHERCGAVRTHEDAENYYYSIRKDVMPSSPHTRWCAHPQSGRDQSPAGA